MPAADIEASGHFVLDASVTAAWLLPQQRSQAALDLLRTERAQFWVPALWRIEVGNVFLMQERRRLISVNDTVRYVAMLARMPIQLDDAVADVSAMAAQINLARARDITVYDAQYLALAQRRRIPLATLDRKLAAAARAVDIPLALALD